MKRDFDLIRAIMLDIEKLPPALRQDDNYHFEHPEYTDNDEIGYALGLLVDRGFVSAKIDNVIGIESHGSFYEVSLTFEGHDFLDSIRDDEIWRHTKDGLEKAGGSTFDLIKELAKELLKQQIKHYSGIELSK